MARLQNSSIAALLLLSACSGGALDTPGAGGGPGSAAPRFALAGLPAGMAGAPYQARLEATGGSPPYLFAIAAGALPEGLRLTGDEIDGTPTAEGTAALRLRVIDSAAAFGEQDFSLEIVPAGSLALSTTALPSAKVGRMYEALLSAIGGTAPYAFTLIAGALPAGLALDTNTIAGVPDHAGDATVTVQVTDASQPPLTASRELRLAVADRQPLTLQPTTLPAAAVSVPYGVDMTVAGGNPPYGLAITGGNVPQGLALNGSRIEGTPQQAGSYAVTVELHDDSVPPLTLRRTYDLQVSAPLAFVTTSLPAGTVGTAYSATFEATGGTPPYAFELASGTLPTGVSFDVPNARLRGTPSQAGAFALEVRVRDAAGGQEDGSFTLSVRSPSGSNDPIPSVVANVTHGVAPLSVYFDGSGTTSPVVSRPFHHLDYRWDFGDATSRHPTDGGPVAAHVFERPGQYTVRLLVTDPDRRTATTDTVITVDDPDVSFSGGATICFSASGDFAGAPTGSQRITTGSFDQAMSHYGTGKRLLFRRGESFQSSARHALGANDSRLGAFGTGTNPDARGVYANNPVIAVSANGQGHVLGVQGDRITVSDLRVTAPAGPDFCVATRRCTQILFHHVVVVGSETAYLFSPSINTYYGEPYSDSLTWWECSVSNCNRYGFFVGGSRMAWVGSLLADTGGSHVLRIPIALGVVMSGNEIGAPGDPRLHSVKLHNNDGVVSEKIVFVGNVVDTDCNWCIAIAPQDDLKDERVRDVLCESNVLRVRGGSSVGFYMACQDATVRNNLVVLTGAHTNYGFAAVEVVRRGIEPAPARVEVLNNTVFADSASGVRALRIVQVSAGTAIVAKNNVGYAPSGTTTAVQASVSVDAAGNYASGNPLFFDTSVDDFRLMPASPCIGRGVPVPVIRDFGGMSRPALGPLPGAFPVAGNG